MVSAIKRYLLLVSVIALAVMISSSVVFASTTKVNNKKYTHPSFYKSSLYRLFHGVDVSYWQHDINWNKSKADGIDFAIMRCGYTALSKFALHQDSTFIKNYKNATKAGVSVGIYYYACATTSTEAKKEANYVISILKNNDINNQLPVVMDYEINSGRTNSVYNSLVKKKGKSAARKRFTNNAVVFMKTLRAAGYEPMFYSYRMLIDKDFSKNYRFNMKDINGSSQYRFWLAQYSTSISYKGNMEIWQFTSTGRVKGMSGNIDRNFWYYPLDGTKTTDGTTSIRKCAVTLSSTEYKYDGDAKKPKVTVKYGTDKLENGTDYAVSYMNNINKGTATVLVHGKGKFSNETYTTFKIGDENVTTDKTTVTDSSALIPKKVEGVKLSSDIDNRTLTVSWDKAKNATVYQVCYKINGAESWTRKSTKNTTYAITDLNKKDTVIVKVRGKNTTSEETINGKYSETLYKYFGSNKNTLELDDDCKVTISWKKPSVEADSYSYTVKIKRAGRSPKTYTTEKTKLTKKFKENCAYSISVTPTLTINGKKYPGSAGAITRVYVAYTNIKSIKPVTGGFKLKWSKLEGEGKPRYKIFVAENKDMEDYQYMTKSKKVTETTIKNLDSGKKYYITMKPYIKIDGKMFNGKETKVKSVTTE